MKVPQLTPNLYSLDELAYYLLFHAFYRFPDLDIQDLAPHVLGISERSLYRWVKGFELDYKGIQMGSPNRAVNVQTHLKRKVEAAKVK